MTLPPAADLIAALRATDQDQWETILDGYAPAIDQLASTADLATWLGITPGSIRSEQTRARANGTSWPEPARRFGRNPAWTYRAIAIYRARMPGSGNRTSHARKDDT